MPHTASLCIVRFSLRDSSRLEIGSRSLVVMPLGNKPLYKICVTSMNIQQKASVFKKTFKYLKDFP